MYLTVYFIRKQSFTLRTRKVAIVEIRTFSDFGCSGFSSLVISATTLPSSTILGDVGEVGDVSFDTPLPFTDFFPSISSKFKFSSLFFSCLSLEVCF